MKKFFPKNLYQRFWKRRKRWQRTLLILLVLGISSIVYLYQWLFVDLPDIDNLEAGLALPSTRIYDRNGKLLYEIVDLYGGSHKAVTLDEMASCLPDATIATEDANFYHHPGVDIEGIARALWINVRGGEVRAGGSTITQQVARNLLLTKQPSQDRTVRRKLRESILAIRLNMAYSREEILTLYLNQTYYGNLAYGVEAASRIYFGKSPASLSLAECAMLAGLPQSPAIYNPLENPTIAKDRQTIVLDLMVKHGYISESEAEQAKKEPLDYSAGTFEILAPHFVAAVWTQLERDYADELYTGGLEVYTTLDLNWQNAAERIARQHLAELNNPPDGSPPKDVHNAALVAIDPYTGQILAMLGSPDYFDESIDGNVNAALAPRQPGSALKPFTYAAAFNPAREEPFTPATMLLDVKTPFVTRRLESYTPLNFGLAEHGPVLVREALASSFNIPAVETLNEIGVQSLVTLVTRLGISTLTDTSRFDLSLTLGGGEVRLVELTAAYSAFANGGQRVEPNYILEIRNSAGETIYEAQTPALGKPELDPRVAYLITDILSDNEARIPAFGTVSSLNIGRPAAAKTGTTTDFRDNWTMGYTPNLVVGVWVGNADNTPMTNVTGITGAGPIWNQFMREVLYGQPELQFERPEGLVRAEVCATSGLLPTEYCPVRKWEWFIDGTVPTESDNFYQPFLIDSRTGLLATEDTPTEFQEEKVYLVLPPEARDWAARQNIPPPPDSAIRVGEEPERPLRMVSPDPYTVFALTPLLPLETQRIRLSVITPPETTSITYWIDGGMVQTIDQAPFDIWWALQPGDHLVWSTAQLADGSSLESQPIAFRVDSYVPPDERPSSGPAE
ncbi:MAG: penicillin-binding protein 1A [Chloroflexota bacterium]|nr:penicillin-binding protein 1C [Chloroflexota bacterium]NOG63668.1 penicillin-binding protein 1C [Chloroflexota bacterium]GIK65100.1 MAG: penicillin-binding protein 1A [Chloroflexota bacterium]